MKKNTAFTGETIISNVKETRRLTEYGAMVARSAGSREGRRFKSCSRDEALITDDRGRSFYIAGKRVYRIFRIFFLNLSVICDTLPKR